MTGWVTGDVVAQSDGGQGYEAVVDGIEEVPVGLEGAEDGGRRQEEEDDEEDGDRHQVEDADVERLVEVAQFGVEVAQEPRGGHHQPVHQRRQQHQRHRDPDQGVDDAEDLPSFR